MANRCYRCARCDTDWPIAANYKVCPACASETFVADLDPLSYDEARQLADEIKRRRDQHEYTERRMDEMFEERFAVYAGVDLSRTATAADGAPECEMR